MEVIEWNRVTQGKDLWQDAVNMEMKLGFMEVTVFHD
jgi:hypothetical protein